MKYLFYAERNGYIPMGSDGQYSVPARTTDKGIRKLAQLWLGKRPGVVYFMPSWTPEMSELGPRAFERYIAEHGVIVARPQRD